MRRLPRKNCAACGKLCKRAVDIYCNNKCQRDKQWADTVTRIEAQGFIENIQQARRYFRYKFVHECMICHNSVWNEEFIPLLIDHIDGNSSNWLLNNLRRICPNCDAQLPTFKARNRGNGRAYRRQRYKEGKSY